MKNFNIKSGGNNEKGLKKFCLIFLFYCFTVHSVCNAIKADSFEFEILKSNNSGALSYNAISGLLTGSEIAVNALLLQYGDVYKTVNISNGVCPSLRIMVVIVGMIIKVERSI